MIPHGSGIHTNGNKSKQTMDHKQFLETIHQASEFTFVSPWHISESSCGPSTHTWTGLSCTCGRSQGQEDHPGWDQSAGNRWRARPVKHSSNQHLNKQYSGTPDNHLLVYGQDMYIPLKCVRSSYPITHLLKLYNIVHKIQNKSFQRDFTKIRAP
jgi:hypothetical protein